MQEIETNRELRWLLEEKYAGKRTPEAERDIARLEQGEHVDYVIGWVQFLGCNIDLRYKPLIPRPETEYWAEKAIEEIQPRLRSARILDLFAGSGCIGVAVLKACPELVERVDFAEKEQAFCKQVEINARLNGIDKRRYRVLQSDIFSGVQGKYDYILANPPYVAEARKARVQQSVVEQEPAQAIFGGNDGLYYIRRFLSEVKTCLVPGGVAYLEFDSPQKADIEILTEQAGAKNVSIRKDQYGKWRYARIVF